MKFNLILISTIFLLISLKIDLIQSQVTSYTVKFLYQVSGNSQNYQPIQPGYLTNKNLKTKFLVHGFTDNGNQSKLRKMAQEIFSAEGASNVYVIIVDWAEGAAGPLYNVAVGNTQETGRQIAAFVNSAGINTANVHCIGHSLGAHCCGQFGKKLWSNHWKILDRISGLDPAAPLFWDDKPLERLDKSDASKVDVIHTDVGFCGYGNQLGHKDFYPSGGSYQPNCSISLNGFDPSCSHSRAVDLFTDSIKQTCQALLCDKYTDFDSADRNSKCRYCTTTWSWSWWTWVPTTICNQYFSQMGYNAWYLNNNMNNVNGGSNSFYLYTNGNSPFCLS